MLSALSYHQKVKDHFRAQPKTWDYFAGASNKEEQLLQFKTELLRNTYKFDPSSEPFIYDKINIIKDKLGLQQLPVMPAEAPKQNEHAVKMLAVLPSDRFLLKKHNSPFYS